MRATQIAAYVFDADLYCVSCVVEAMIARGVASPGARGMDVEDVRAQIAGANAFDLDDETTFDSGELAKPVFGWELSLDQHCGRCGGDYRTIRRNAER